MPVIPKGPHPPGNYLTYPIPFDTNLKMISGFPKVGYASCPGGVYKEKNWIVDERTPPTGGSTNDCSFWG